MKDITITWKVSNKRYKEIERASKAWRYKTPEEWVKAQIDRKLLPITLKKNTT